MSSTSLFRFQGDVNPPYLSTTSHIPACNPLAPLCPVITPRSHQASQLERVCVRKGPAHSSGRVQHKQWQTRGETNTIPVINGYAQQSLRTIAPDRGDRAGPHHAPLISSPSPPLPPSSTLSSSFAFLQLSITSVLLSFIRASHGQFPSGVSYMMMGDPNVRLTCCPSSPQCQPLHLSLCHSPLPSKVLFSVSATCCMRLSDFSYLIFTVIFCIPTLPSSCEFLFIVFPCSLSRSLTITASSRAGFGYGA